MAIDPCGWQVLLVSLIPTQSLQASEQRDLSCYFFSLTTCASGPLLRTASPSSVSGWGLL